MGRLLLHRQLHQVQCYQSSASPPSSPSQWAVFMTMDGRISMAGLSGALRCCLLAAPKQRHPCVHERPGPRCHHTLAAPMRSPPRRPCPTPPACSLQVQVPGRGDQGQRGELLTWLLLDPALELPERVAGRRSLPIRVERLQAGC